MALDPDLEDILPNYDARHEAGESYDELAAGVEAVGDRRLAAVLRQRAAGEAPGEADKPKGRTAGNKSVAAAEAEAVPAETAAAE